jgi:hypothetical protein
LPLEPHQFWQDIVPAGTFDPAPADGFVDGFPASLPDGRQLLLPIRVLPGDGSAAVASLIINQASFAVEDQQKTIYLDPRSLPLLEGRRVAVVDDVISSGTSMTAVLSLLERADVAPVAIAAAMLQGSKWRAALAAWQDRIVAPLASLRLSRTESGRWIPEQVG